MREKLHIDNGIFTQSRITPACAGKTFISDIMVMRARDHPRMCGKNVRIAALEISCVGSPPRVREKRDIWFKPNGGYGITPACAGKTL